MLKKPCFRGPLNRTQDKCVETPLAIWMTAPLTAYLLITLKVVALEKVSFCDTQNSKAVC